MTAGYGDALSQGAELTTRTLSDAPGGCGAFLPYSIQTSIPESEECELALCPRGFLLLVRSVARRNVLEYLLNNYRCRDMTFFYSIYKYVIVYNL